MAVMIKEVYIPKDIELETYTKLAIFNYDGDDDPVQHIDDAVSQYTMGYRRCDYSEYIDMNMDNPWVRIITITLSKDEMRNNKLKEICQK